MNDSSVAISVANLSYAIKHNVLLRDVNFALKKGEMVALCGKNGVGKTTLLQLLSQELKPASGEVIQQVSQTVYVTDSPALYPDWTVAMFLRFSAQTLNCDEEHLYKVISDCQLDSVLAKNCQALSQGYRQRVSLARALLSSPEVLLLDEPFNGLDVMQQRFFMAVIEAVSKQCAVLFSHHNYADVAQFADHILYIKDTKCHAVNLPKAKNSFWVQWQSVKFAEKAQQTESIYGNCSYHVCQSNQAKKQLMSDIAVNDGVKSITETMPESAVAAILEIL